MPSNFALKSMNAIHRLILGVSRGKAGWTAGIDHYRSENRQTPQLHVDVTTSRR
jgi:hypothetical protein